VNNNEKQDRFSVPLYMIEGNMGVLLENTLNCEGISFKRYTPPDSDAEGVVLMIHNADKEQAVEIGFQFKRMEDDSRVRD